MNLINDTFNTMKKHGKFQMELDKIHYINLLVQYDDWKMIGAVDSLSNLFMYMYLISMSMTTNNDWFCPSRN